MSERWSLAGYEVLHLVDGGSAGDLWCARELATGELVALRRQARGADAQALRRSAALQADLTGAVRLRDVVDDGQVLVLVLDHAQGGGLETVLRRRGALEPGEVVTIGVPLAQTLAAAAARGLGHGGLTAAAVRFAADGRPLLAGLGLHDDFPDPGEDVAALATLCLGLLRPDPAPPPDVAALVEVLEQARAADSQQRPDAPGLAAQLRRAHPAAPVRLHPAAPAGRHARLDGAGRRAGTAGPVVAGGLALLVAAGAALGWWSGRGGEAAVPVPVPVPAVPSGAAASRSPSPPVPTGGAAGAAPAWAHLLDVLDRARAEAFASGDASVLQRVHAPGSATLAGDLRVLRQLDGAGLTAVGVRHAVRDVTVLTATADRARLRVVDVLAAHEVRDAAGAVVRRAPPRPERPHLVELVRTEVGWRLVSVRAG